VNLSWDAVVDVALSDEDYLTYIYILEYQWWGLFGDIIETRWDLAAFNGKEVSQLWILWAADSFADGYGYIDYWWIKIYYGEPIPEYCEAFGYCMEEEEYIRDVIVGTINNTNTDCQDYSDYTLLSTTMEIETGYPMTVVSGISFEETQCGIWVDWNQDADFYDAGETIAVSGSPGFGPYTATITPPAGAALGDTRMRIRITWGDPLEPCGYAYYGEVEDYTITVVAESGLAGDLVPPDGVDMRDYAVLAGQWRQAPGEPSADIAPEGGDGIVDWLDVEVQVGNWLAGL
jgi:hypothetical protein